MVYSCWDNSRPLNVLAQSQTRTRTHTHSHARTHKHSNTPTCTHTQSELAYGNSQRGRYITPGAVLVFELEILDILGKTKEEAASGKDEL